MSQAADADEAPAGPLGGYRILDLTSVIMGPYATQILADLGAEVITIESRSGDTNRHMDAGPHPQLSGVALNLHRNKRNVSINIKDPEGLACVLELAKTCDAVVTNLRPAVLERAELSYDDVREIRPDIVFCQAHGYASDTPQANEPAYDDIIQAACGLADAAARTTGTPALMPTVLADKVCGLTIAYSVCAALARRERTGKGEHIEVPMVDTMRAFMLVEHGAAGIHHPNEGRAGYRRLLSPERRPQPTSDGWICVLPYAKEHYDDLFARYLPDLVGDNRYATARSRIDNSPFLYQQLRAILAHRTTAEWLTFCREHQIPSSPVVTLDEIVDNLPDAVHPVAGPYKVVPSPVRFSEAGRPSLRPAPLIGQDTDAVLSELGIDDTWRRSMRARGVIAPDSTTPPQPGPP